MRLLGEQAHTTTLSEGGYILTTSLTTSLTATLTASLTATLTATQGSPTAVGNPAGRAQADRERNRRG